ncbi:MAG: GAF domain-containing protein [Gallionellaceae bacterium]
MTDEHDWIARCEAEPLAHSGAIQPHGALLYLDADLRISHISAQIWEFLPYSPASLLGEQLPQEFAALLAPAFAKLSAEPGSRGELFAVRVDEESILDIIVIRSSDGFVVELLPHALTQINFPPHLLQISSPRNILEMQALHQGTVRLFHELTGFDRVMIYAFRDDGDGEVLAEARRDVIYGSYLGLRFPGSDIPLIARTLYLNNPWRLIPDSQAPAIPLLSSQHTPPNLTWSDLRSVSPMHQHYLSNMGVHASLSFPIVVSGALWGLIACHHAKPRNLPLAALRAASHQARHYSLQLTTWHTHLRMRLMDMLTHRFETMHMTLLRHGHALSAIFDIAPSLFEQFDACGLAIRLHKDWAYTGIVPTLPALERVDEWLEYECHELVSSSDCMGRTIRALGLLPVSGVLALKLRTRRQEDLHIFIFRQELLHEVEWGGNPQKPVEFHDGEIDIAPRRSFEKWLEKRLGYSKSWLNEDRHAALRLRQLFTKLYG